uniref:Linker for activation of T-cells family member 2 isoform X1 n=1 Tax=Pogona vitticeps TaxID=103695 RepID=A0ABM5EN18_9SAUR
MSQAELIWGAFSLMFLGALVTMCMKCQGKKQDENSFGRQTEQHVAADSTVGRERNSTCAQTHTLSLRYEDDLRLEMPHSYSISRQEYLKAPYGKLGPSQSTKQPSLPRQFESRVESRYQNLEKGMPTEFDTAYIQPISTDHYCSTQDFLRPSTGSDEDSPSYQNVSGPSGSNRWDSTNVEVYENSTIIQLWKHSQSQGHSSEDEDDEPDYVNENPQRRRMPTNGSKFGGREQG